MRSLHCQQISGPNVEDVLAEFNSRRAQLGLRDESDLVSVDVRTYSGNLSVLTGPEAESATVVVTFVYWG